MSERALRGTRLGATSYESDTGIDLAPRQDVDYVCANGHQFTMPFSMEAEVPAVWECRVCGAQALRRDSAAPEEKSGKPARTHWDMLLERRSMAELEEVLAERLGVLRGGGIPFAVTAATARNAGRAAQAQAKAEPADADPGPAEPGPSARPAMAAAGRPAAKKSTSAKSAKKAAPATKSTPRSTRKAPAKSSAER